MTTEVKTKKIEKTTSPTIHIRIKKHVTYFVKDKIKTAVTTSRVVHKRKKETNEDLA